MKSTIDASFLDRSEKPPFQFYLVINNQPLDVETFKDLYSKATVCICCDGGANRVYDSFTSPAER